jgi:hypothetical protein
MLLWTGAWIDMERIGTDWNAPASVSAGYRARRTSALGVVLTAPTASSDAPVTPDRPTNSATATTPETDVNDSSGTRPPARPAVARGIAAAFQIRSRG